MKIANDWYALFAMPTGSVESMSEVIYPALGLDFESVDSGAWGYYTISGDPRDGECVSVYSNRNRDEDGEYFYVKSHKGHPVLVAVYNTDRLVELSKLLVDQLGGEMVKHRAKVPPPPEPFQ
jgi:hypothetical protein